MEEQAALLLEPYLPFIGAILGVTVAIVIQQLISRWVKRLMAEREKETRTITTHRYAQIKAIALAIGRMNEDVVLRGRVITHLEMFLMLDLYSEYKALGGNGAVDFWVDQIKTAHGYGTEAWDNYSKIGKFLIDGARVAPDERRKI